MRYGVKSVSNTDLLKPYSMIISRSRLIGLSNPAIQNENSLREIMLKALYHTKNSDHYAVIKNLILYYFGNIKDLETIVRMILNDTYPFESDSLGMTMSGSILVNLDLSKNNFAKLIKLETDSINPRYIMNSLIYILAYYNSLFYGKYKLSAKQIYRDPDLPLNAPLTVRITLNQLSSRYRARD